MKKTLIERMEAKGVPKAWVNEVKAMLNHVDQLDHDNDILIRQVASLAIDRQDLFRIIRNTADTLADDCKDMGDVEAVVYQLDSMLVAAENAGEWHDET